MAGREDPRLDRVIAALNTLEAAQRAQAAVVDRLQAELSSAQHDAAEAREAAAYAKAETAAYQAELSATARRDDLERVAERLDVIDAALVDVRRRDAQATSVRDQVVKVSRALAKAVSLTDLSEVAQRVEQIDDRLQVRLAHLETALAETVRSSAALAEQLTDLTNETGGVGQALDRRIGAVEEAQGEVVERFENVVRTAESEIDRVAGHLDRRIAEVAERIDAQAAAVAALPDPTPTLDLHADEIADLKRSIRVLRSMLESDRTVLRELDQRVFGADGVAARLMELADVVVEHTERPPLVALPDPLVLGFQSRIEDLVTRIEALGSLRTRVELLEQRAQR